MRSVVLVLTGLGVTVSACASSGLQPGAPAPPVPVSGASLPPRKTGPVTVYTVHVPASSSLPPVDHVGRGRVVVPWKLLESSSAHAQVVIVVNFGGCTAPLRGLIVQEVSRQVAIGVVADHHSGLCTSELRSGVFRVGLKSPLGHGRVVPLPR
jgi:hypothetical protein